MTVQSFQETTNVYVPVENIAPYTKITTDKVTIKSVPVSAIIGTKITREEDIVNKYTHSTLIAGQPIVKEHLSDYVGGEITAKLNSINRLDIKALALPVTNITSFGSKIEVGDRIDILTNDEEKAFAIAEYIPVIEVIKDNNGISGIVVELDAKQAKEVSYHLNTGNINILINPQHTDRPLVGREDAR